LWTAAIVPAHGEDQPSRGREEPATKMAPLDIEDLEMFVAQQRVRPTAPAPRPAAPVPVARSHDALYTVVHVEFSTAAACRDYKPPQGAAILCRHGRFADLFADATRKGLLDDIAQPATVRWLDLGPTVRIPPPPRENDLGERSRAFEPIVRGGLDGLTGKGVVIAVLDTGLDFRHKDFITVDEDGRPTSRLLYFWDTLTPPAGSGKPGAKAPLSYPNGASIGTLYSRDELTAELREPRGNIAVTDTNGHGTACAGIAAGNGNSLPEKRYAGVAPAADLVAVRIGSGPGLENTYLLNAICGWLDETFPDRCVVVSCSFGGHRGGHDGYLVSERHLNSRFPRDLKRRAICVAAGNDGERPAHGRLKLPAGQTKASLTWAATGNGLVQVYLDTDDIKDVKADVIGYPGARIRRFKHPLSGSYVLEVTYNQTEPGQLGGELELSSRSGKALDASAYLWTYSGEAGFIGRCRSKTCLIGSPGTASNAITVASYDFNDEFEQNGKIITLGFHGQRLTIGGISGYSSPGYPRLQKDIKPDFAAPGQYFAAPAVKSIAAASLDTSKAYRIFNGTSAATPYTAGVIALMMERKPELTFGEIKDRLKRNLSTDDKTGETPNVNWGYGKLDFKAVQAVLKGLQE
jgi:subtilisin family serine protease